MRHLLLIALISAACSDGSGGVAVPPPPSAVPSSIRLTVDGSSSGLRAGASRQLHATVLNALLDTIKGAIVTWVSDQPELASVSQNGLLTLAADFPHGSHSYRITASAGVAATDQIFHTADWALTSSQHPMTLQRSIVASLRGQGGGWLYLVCQGGLLTANVTGIDVTSAGLVQYQFSQRQLVSEGWVVAGDGGSLFAPDEGAALALAEVLTSSDSLYFAYDKWGGGRSRLVFSLANARSAIPAVRHACQ